MYVIQKLLGKTTGSFKLEQLAILNGWALSAQRKGKSTVLGLSYVFGLAAGSIGEKRLK